MERPNAFCTMSALKPSGRVKALRSWAFPRRAERLGDQPDVALLAPGARVRLLLAEEVATSARRPRSRAGAPGARARFRGIEAASAHHGARHSAGESRLANKGPRSRTSWARVAPPAQTMRRVEGRRGLRARRRWPHAPALACSGPTCNASPHASCLSRTRESPAACRRECGSWARTSKGRNESPTLSCAAPHQTNKASPPGFRPTARQIGDTMLGGYRQARFRDDSDADETGATGAGAGRSARGSLGNGGGASGRRALIKPPAFGQPVASP